MTALCTASFGFGFSSWGRSPQWEASFPCWVTYRLDLALWSIPSQYSPSSLSFSVLSWSSSSCFFMKTDSSVRVIEMFSAAPASDEENICMCLPKSQNIRTANAKYLLYLIKIKTDDPNYSTFGSTNRGLNYIQSSWVHVASCCLSVLMLNTCQLTWYTSWSSQEENLIFETDREDELWSAMC